MKRTYIAGALAGLVGFVLCAPPDVLAARNPMVSGQEARVRTQKLNETIEWNTSFDKAKRDAQRSGKPIFWVHMLGSINGHT